MTKCVKKAINVGSVLIFVVLWERRYRIGCPNWHTQRVEDASMNTNLLKIVAAAMLLAVSINAEVFLTGSP